MRTFAAIVLAATAIATTAFAQPDGRLSDVDYIQAARCKGLVASGALGDVNTAGIDALLKTQGRGRVAFIYDKADQKRTDAYFEAKRAQGAGKDRLIAERDGVCKRFLG